MSSLIERAAAGELPAWAEVRPDRHAHLTRVADLLESWAVALELPPRDVMRWRAAGWLHDALRDANPGTLRPLMPKALADLPDPLLHGPAVAVRLGRDGVRDPPLLAALTYHTIGHPQLDRLGHALYLADYLEPGRSFEASGRGMLRARMPAALDEVLRFVVAARIKHLLEQRRAVRTESIAFWNSLVAT